MGVTIELQNLGDAELCREISVQLEHVFSGRQGAWRAADNWDLRIEGPMDLGALIVCPVLLLNMSPQRSAQSF